MQHPNEHGPERPVLLAVDQQLADGVALGVGLELADPLGSLQVGEHRGAGPRRRGVSELARCPLPKLETLRHPDS